MKKTLTLIAITAMTMVATVAAMEAHVFWYDPLGANYDMSAANGGPNLPSDAIVHKGKMMTSCQRATKTPGVGWFCGNGLDNDQGRCGMVWSEDLCNPALNLAGKRVVAAYFRGEYNDGWGGNGFNNAGAMVIRKGCVDMTATISLYGDTASVIDQAVWADAANPLTWDMKYNGDATANFQAEDTLNFTALQGNNGAGSTPLYKKWLSMNVTNQVQWILDHIGTNQGSFGGQYGIAMVVKQGDGNLGKLNLMSTEDASGLGAPGKSWSEDNNTVHLLVFTEDASGTTTKDLASYDGVNSNPTIAAEDVAVAGQNEVSVTNEPNPANPTTKISFNTGKAKNGSLKVYTLEGKLVYSANVSGKGSHVFSGKNLTSGIYVCRLVAGNQVASHNLILMK